MRLQCLLFLFKQKTAYEIPKRDWSSDVCSSDLIAREIAALGKRASARNGDVHLAGDVAVDDHRPCRHGRLRDVARFVAAAVELGQRQPLGGGFCPSRERTIAP